MIKSSAKWALLLAGVMSFGAFAADEAKPAAAYKNDLSSAAIGKPPEELFILNGKFQIAEVSGNKVLELPGNPVDGFGILFGPENQQATEVSARIYGTNVGRMFPEFGIGANDSGGWKAWLLPGQNALAIRFKDFDEKVRVAYTWQSGTWTQLKLRVAPAGGDKWLIQAKAWPDGKPEPADWMLSHTADGAPPTGRAGAWGHAYSGTSILFDDFAVNPVK